MVASSLPSAFGPLGDVDDVAVSTDAFGAVHVLLPTVAHLRLQRHRTSGLACDLTLLATPDGLLSTEHRRLVTERHMLDLPGSQRLAAMLRELWAQRAGRQPPTGAADIQQRLLLAETFAGQPDERRAATPTKPEDVAWIANALRTRNLAWTHPATADTFEDAPPSGPDARTATLAFGSGRKITTTPEQALLILATREIFETIRDQLSRGQKEVRADLQSFAVADALATIESVEEIAARPAGPAVAAGGYRRLINAMAPKLAPSASQTPEEAARAPIKRLQALSMIELDAVALIALRLWVLSWGGTRTGARPDEPFLLEAGFSPDGGELVRSWRFGFIRVRRAPGHYPMGYACALTFHGLLHAQPIVLTRFRVATLAKTLEEATEQEDLAAAAQLALDLYDVR